jgi:prolyl-tRNA editing enzyme YbaK/EbsC (Cys-tRNA(Pro) deacylase)
MEALGRELGAEEVAFAGEDEVLDLTGFKPGAVSPVGLATDREVVAYPAVFTPDVVSCGGGTTEAMLRIRTEDLEALLGARIVPMARRA